jgi:predicted methyltransferase
MRHFKSDEPYTEIENYPQVKEILDQLRKVDTHTIEVEKLKLELTDLGRQFIRSCVIDKGAQERS